MSELYKASLPGIPEPAATAPAALPRTQPVLVREMAAKPEGAQEALEDRDPNNLNQHVQIVWDDIIGEPEGARSPECAWRLSNVCFQHARNWCYTVLTVLIAPPCALLLGCGFACLAFEPEVSRLVSVSVWRPFSRGVTSGRDDGETPQPATTIHQIWCTAPCLRCVKIYFASLRTMVQSCMAAVVVPAAEAVGHVCRHIRVNFRKDAPEERDLLVI